MLPTESKRIKMFEQAWKSYHVQNIQWTAAPSTGPQSNTDSIQTQSQSRCTDWITFHKQNNDLFNQWPHGTNNQRLNRPFPLTCWISSGGSCEANLQQTSWRLVRTDRCRNNEEFWSVWTSRGSEVQTEIWKSSKADTKAGVSFSMIEEINNCCWRCVSSRDHRQTFDFHLHLKMIQMWVLVVKKSEVWTKMFKHKMVNLNFSRWKSVWAEHSDSVSGQRERTNLLFGQKSL